jgi:SAM-dependent methyltransferase
VTLIADAHVLQLSHWHRDVSIDERALVASAIGPVLDVGCGPGRFVEALSASGVHAVGIDAALSAVALARARGVRAVPVSVFDHAVPVAVWRTVLLLDGNIGIGGAPAQLLARVRELLTSGGHALVEFDPPGASTRTGVVEFEVATGMVGWFPWAWVSIDDAPALAAAEGFEVAAVESFADRWFARLLPSVR